MNKPVRHPSATSWQPVASLREWAARKWAQLAASDALSLSAQLRVFAVVLLALFSRRPDLFLHAQFYAEDGRVWFAQAYNGGWLRSLTLPEAGYLNTLQRLAAGFTLLVPFRWAPLLMAICGLLMEALPVPLLLSSRCRNWGPLPLRCMFAALYVALPNSLEIHVVLTNAQWHLALLLALIAFASPPVTAGGIASDIVLFVVGSVCGPFCIVLLPLLLLYGWFGAKLRPQRWSMMLAAVSAPGALLQVWLILHTHGRGHTVLGASPILLLRLLGGHVFTASILGSSGLASWQNGAALIFVLLADVFGFALLLYCFRRQSLAMRFLIAFCGLIFAASLHAPLFPGTTPLWQQLAVDGGGRYWFFPMLAFLWSAAWCAFYAPSRVWKRAAICLLCLLPIGVARNWYHRGFPNEHFAPYARQFENAQPGGRETIPIVPDGLSMELVKK